MRIVSLDWSDLATGPMQLPHGTAVDPEWVEGTLREHRLPEGFPIVVDDDGGVAGCRSINQYLLDAWAQRAYDLDSMRKFHVYHLARLLRFLRLERTTALAQETGVSVGRWLADHKEPDVDLIDARRHDLTAYRDARSQSIQGGSLDTEMGCISAFYRYARSAGWIDHDPVPRRNGRNTLLSGTRDVRQTKFLTSRQARHFLDVGMRGDGAPVDMRSVYSERDYSYALLLASTGLRREECAYLFDSEVPPPDRSNPNGVHTFRRKGKKGVVRYVYIAEEVARAVDLYRQAERGPIVAKAQRTLRRKLDNGKLFVVDRLTTRAGQPAVVLNGHAVSTLTIKDRDRARAVTINDDGTIEPLCLFLSRYGLPPVLERWEQLFADARARVQESGTPDRPPAHITVTPHTMRHTFAVRMLAALMREGRDRDNNPYLLLANPVLTVKELLGHADVATTHKYLFAAETWSEGVPDSVRRAAVDLTGHTEDNPGEPVYDDELED